VRVYSGKQASDGEPEDLQCDAEESRQCAFSCGECSNTPLCTADAQPLLDSKLHSGPATGEDTGEEGYPEEGEGVCVYARVCACVLVGTQSGMFAFSLSTRADSSRVRPTGGQAVSKRIALCVTGAREDGAVDAYAMRSVINCLLPSLRRDRTDLFVVASDGWRNVQVPHHLSAAATPPLTYVLTCTLNASPSAHPLRRRSASRWRWTAAQTRRCSR
jgi:hypothetical protein